MEAVYVDTREHVGLAKFSPVVVARGAMFSARKRAGMAGEAAIQGRGDRRTALSIGTPPGRPSAFSSRLVRLHSLLKTQWAAHDAVLPVTRTATSRARIAR
jgi:hypothetical protein